MESILTHKALALGWHLGTFLALFALVWHKMQHLLCKSARVQSANGAMVVILLLYFLIIALLVFDDKVSLTEVFEHIHDSTSCKTEIRSSLYCISAVTNLFPNESSTCFFTGSVASLKRGHPSFCMTSQSNRSSVWLHSRTPHQQNPCETHHKPNGTVGISRQAEPYSKELLQHAYSIIFHP